MARKRILFAIGSLDCGGSERQLLSILQHIDRSQFEPHLYLLARQGIFLEQVPDDVTVTAFSDDFHPPTLYFPGRILRQQVAHLSGHLASLKPNAVYDRAFLLPLVTNPACRRMNLPRLSTIVSDPHRALQFSVSRFRRFKRRILRTACQQASKVLAVSDGVREAAKSYYNLADSKLETTPNGFLFDEIDRLAGEPISDARSSGADPAPAHNSFPTSNSAGDPVSISGSQQLVQPEEATSPLRIVSVGRLQHEKDFGTLLRSFDQAKRQTNREMTLTIIGDGPIRNELESLAVQLGRADSIRFVGFDANPYRWFKRADLFCLTSKYEGMPNVLVEALACQVPVISTDCPHGPREILLDGALGDLVPVGDSMALANAIVQISENMHAARERAQAANRSIRDRYSIKTSVSRLEEVLLRCAK